MVIAVTLAVAVFVVGVILFSLCLGAAAKQGDLDMAQALLRDLEKR